MEMQTTNLNTQTVEVNPISTETRMAELNKQIELLMAERGKLFRENLSNGDIVKIRTGKNRVITEVVVFAISDISVFVKNKDGSKIGRSHVKEVLFADLIQ